MKEDRLVVNFTTPYSRKEKARRLVWNLVWALLYRPFPRWMLNGWKRFLLRRFGCKIDNTAYIHPSARVFMPWNLEMFPHSCIASGVDCYNAAKITLKAYATVSQRSFLCTASHNISSSKHEQIEKPIVIGERAWVAAEAFIGPGVTIGEGAVVGARAAVFKDVEAWTVVGGNPAKYIKDRIIKE